MGRVYLYVLKLILIASCLLTGVFCKCKDNEFKCNNGDCISKKLKCNDHADCKDGSDEQKCENVKLDCSNDAYFKCNNSTSPPACVLKAWVCDRETDCKDGSDEVDCQHNTCPDDLFSCKSGSKCIQPGWRCDGENDCPDGSDEQNCTVINKRLVLCPVDQFKCDDGQCVNKKAVCDGFKDCFDGSDENPIHCSSVDRCTGSAEFHCSKSLNNSCIPITFLCDGHKDCQGGEDEEVSRCALHHKCKYNEYHCAGTLTCISKWKLCDNQIDCEGGTDEGPKCRDSVCEDKCDEHCQEYPTGIGECICKDGYHFVKENCSDVNECKMYPDICDQVCVNTIGGYECKCHHDFILSKDNRTCHFNGSDEPDIVFIDIKDVKYYSLKTGLMWHLITNLTRGVALDYDAETRRLFYTDVTKNLIYSSQMHNFSKRVTESEAIVRNGLAVPDGIAIDWVAHNIYFAESSANRIDVCDFKGQHRTALISTEITSPRGLAVDPRVGLLFITDWGGAARILRSRMDGTNLTTVVTDTVGWPNGITIDYVEKRVYWVDARHDYIDSILYDGSDRRNVIRGKQFVPHPFAISLYEDYLYFTDWVKKGIVRVNKHNNSDYQILVENLSRPMDLQVVSSKRQPAAANPCKNSKCRHLCAIKAENQFTCLCGTRSRLASNGLDCKRVDKFLIFARSWEVRGISLDEDYEHDVMTPILGLSSAVGTDFDSANENVYFSDVRTNKIGRVSIKEVSGGKIEWIIDKGLQNPDGVAVDWIGGNLYWTDSKSFGKSVIGVSKLDGRFQKSLINEQLGKPRAIVVHPKKGYLFYTDWLAPVAKIGRADMDGKNLVILINTELAWPNGLSIDYYTQHVYWGDAKIDRIERMNLDGTNREVIVEKTHHSFGLAVDETYIYWTDWLEKKIQRAEKRNVSNVSVLRKGYGGLMEIQIVDKKLQQGSNLCSVSNKCAQLCFPVPNNTYACGCGFGFTLQPDNSCKPGNTTTTTSCFDGQFQCKIDDLCIKQSWKCDGHADCKDASDEMNCENKTCRPNQLKCTNQSYVQCISTLWKCDGAPDCDNGSDEVDCTYNATSCDNEINIPCKTSGGCIDPAWKCDGYMDCKDGSDEDGCSPKECDLLTQFQCQSDKVNNGRLYGPQKGICIPITWQCDGYQDCPDGSDEDNKKCSKDQCMNFFESRSCSNQQCLGAELWCDGINDCGDWSDERFCNNGTVPTATDLKCHEVEFNCSIELQCVSNYSRCDHILDCNDGTDEVNCSYSQCDDKEHFFCENKKCILSNYQCDGSDDCGDNSDEIYCDTAQREGCSHNEWTCKDGKTCVKLDKVCDGKNDCPDADDEGPRCKLENPCSQKNGECLHQCFKTPIGARCVCNEGYILQNDTCGDVNECETSNGLCTHFCFNTKGSYKCTCAPGFTLRPDNKTCSARGPAPLILFSDHKEVRRINPLIGKGDVLVRNLKSAIGVDYHWKEQRIYWSDVSEDKIERMFFNGTGREEIVNRGMNSPEGLAVDWIAGNIYWTDMRLNTIEAAKLNGSKRSIILSDNLDAPRAITVDPRNGLMFWTDWGKRPRIERADMDGGNRSTIVIEKVYWPNGITLDLPTKHVYFVDARLDILDRMNYDGSERVTIVHGNSGMIKHPFALSIFEDLIFFTDWTPGSIRKIHKHSGGSKFIFKNNLKKPMDIQILHPSRQPRHNGINNYCAKSNCSDLCVLKPGGYSCKCPFGYHLLPDGQTCEIITEVLLYARRQEIRGISLIVNDTLDKILPITGTQNAIGIDFHYKKQYIYWTDVSKDSISRIKLDGTEREDVIPSGLPAPDGIAIDWIADNMYWTDADTDKIEVARLDGRYRKVLIATNLTHPRAIVLHPVKGKMIWTDWGKKTIEIADLDGTNRRKLVTGDERPIGYPNGITINFADERVYWCDANFDMIESVRMDGTDRKIIIQKSQLVKHPFAMASLGDYIYWTDWGRRAIMRFNLKTNESAALRENYLSLMGIRIYHSERQQGTNNCSSNPCSHLCFAKTETDYICSCATGFKLNKTDNHTCVGADSFLLFSTTTEVRAIPTHAKVKTESIVPVLGLKSSYAIDYYFKMATIYIVDDTKDAIYSVKQDGSQPVPVITSRLDRPQGIAVDWVAENLYWTDAGTRMIEVSRLNGSHRLVLVDQNLESPRSIALYPSKGLMYWTDWGSKNPKIERAAMDGSGRITIVNSTKMIALKSSINWPNGMTIDYGTDLIYWVDANSDILVQMDLNGDHMKIVLRNLSHPYAITVDDMYLYWTDWTDQSIFRYAKNATAGDQKVSLLGGLSNIRDVHFYDKSRQTGSSSCAHNGGCQHLCLATSSTTRRCVCTTGRLAADQKSCDKVEDFLIFAKRNEILFLDLDPRRRSPPHKPITLPRNAIGIDFDYETKSIYYSDIYTKEIRKTDLNGSVRKTLFQGLKTPDGVAFDWLSKRLYWTDAQENTINRLSYNLTKEVLVHEKLDEPRAIALSPCDDYMYWTDWGDKPYIRRASMDGFNPKAIIHSNLGWPNGLAVDLIDSRIYWADARTDKIESATLDGLDRRVVVVSVPHVFGVTLYDDFIYWTDWVTRSVMRADKHTGLDRVTLKEKLDAQPMDIKVFSAKRQNCTRTPCFQRGGCSHICNVINNTRSCSCPKDKPYKLYGKTRCILQPVAEHCQNLKDSQFLCSNGQDCIENWFFCDGDKDCEDGSDEDEMLCAQHVCPDDKFTCKGTHKCISKNWLCDGESDCPDAIDEQGCNKTTIKCNEETEFTCNNGHCIDKANRCDDEYNCLDRSDEVGCLSRTCRPGYFKCKNASGCIRNAWLCDGFNDCKDGSDEIASNCHIGNCTDNQFLCIDKKRCIPSVWKCDGDPDCPDGSDETSCDEEVTCSSQQKKCASGTSCIDEKFWCDGEEDCPDSSDETNHCNVTCEAGSFKCPNKSKCIPYEYVCDQENDCGDGSDESEELNCDYEECESRDFKCNNRLCIRKLWRCDGDDDCGDGSDEKNCQCQQNQRNCTSGECISKEKFCDGRKDCLDGSDEVGCSQTCSLRCGNGTCIADEMICNKKIDCDDASDEKSCSINECANQQISQCSQICTDLKQGFKCSCKQGFALQKDNKTCLASCTDYSVHGCSHFCINSTLNNYECRCAEGYALDANRRVCKQNTPKQPYLLTANKHFITNLTITKKTQSFQIVLNDLTWVAGVNYHLKSRKVFWIDHDDRILRRSSLDDNKKKIESIHNAARLFTIDWVADNIYWVTQDTIFVSTLNGNYRKTLYSLTLHRHFDNKIASIVCHPQRGWLYFAMENQVMRVGMDGSKASVVYQEIWGVTDMTIDYVSETLFLASSDEKSIFYIHLKDYTGTKNSVKLNLLVDKVGEIKGLTVFEDFIYYSSYKPTSISSTHKPYTVKRVHRLTGANTTTVKTSRKFIFGITLVHPLRQPKHPNPCKKAKCDQLCLLGPNNSAQCACPDEFHLSSNGRTCLSNCTTNQFQCNDTKCITKSWQCDGERDCPDGSDEENCSNRKCSPDEFQCLKNNKCIKRVQICDGDNDCTDGSNEDDSDENKDMCRERVCFSYQFRCDNHNCILKSHRCNNITECNDGSDEKGCGRVASCSSDKFQCDDGRCIAKNWVCDGEKDCVDNSDEEPKKCNNTVCPTNFHKCKNSKCIYQRYLCDGDNDCSDGSDESHETCSAVTCDPNTQKSCADGRCISKHWVCDGEKDCPDGSDESQCTPTKCSDEEFSCTNNNCVLKKWKCDGENDCGDNSDELNCPTTNECSNGNSQFKQCNNNKQCIPAAWFCDGVPDCSDLSDEKDCSGPEKHCLVNDFQCYNSQQCIPSLWHCDNDTDCFDSSDESHEMCASENFCNGAVQFRCQDSGICIGNFRQCDGVKDCSDGSDEHNCVQQCKTNEIKCTPQGPCVNLNRKCDYVKDCPNGEDEQNCHYRSTEGVTYPVTCADCNTPHMTCSRTTDEWLDCACVNGTRVEKLPYNQLQCVDYDECSMQSHVCDQKCENLPHSYKCSCVNGYQKMSDGVCKAEGSLPIIFIPTGSKTKGSGRLIQLSAHRPSKHTKKSNEMKIFGDITTFDFYNGDYLLDGDTTRLFIVGKKGKEIKGIRIKELSLFSGGRYRRVSEPYPFYQSFDIPDSQADAIQVDYIGKNIVWVDNRRTKRGIYMANMTGKHSTMIVKGKTDSSTKIEGLAVDSENGHVYWSERSNLNATIYRARLDGSEVKAFISDKLLYPISLQIDLPSNRLFWCDTKKHSIESVRLDGTNRFMVVDRLDQLNLRFPSSIDVFENFVYGLTQRGGKLFKMDKSGKGQPKTIKSDIPKAFHIKLFQESRQLHTDKNFTNPCLNAYCPQMCVVIDNKAKCICDHGNVEKCQPPPCNAEFCHHRGTCVKTIYNENICNCVGRYTAHTRCDELCPCANKGQCLQHPKGRGVWCQCAKGYGGVNCQLQCNTTCFNGADCSIDSMTNNITCSCLPGFGGEYCENVTCESLKCTKEGEQCQIVNGKAECICVGDYCDDGETSATRTIMIVAPFAIVIALIIIVIIVVLVRRHRHASPFAPRKIKDIEMENPLYTYSPFDNDNDDDDNEDTELPDPYLQFATIDERENAKLVINEHDDF